MHSTMGHPEPMMYVVLKAILDINNQVYRYFFKLEMLRKKKGKKKRLDRVILTACQPT